jgi:hypothetical protein
MIESPTNPKLLVEILKLRSSGTIAAAVEFIEM